MADLCVSGTGHLPATLRDKRPSPWKLVTDELPEPGVLVLACGAKGGKFLGMRGHRTYTHCGSTNEIYMSVPNARRGRFATHGMRLPGGP